MRIASFFLLLSLIVNANAMPKAELSAKTMDGQKVRLKDLRGKLVIINFWATWCQPCREEMPMLVRAARANEDLLFIAVSVDDAKTQGKIPESVKLYGITFPVWTGSNGDDLFRLSKGEAVPATIFIDRDGTVQASVSGQIRENELEERIQWLKGDRKVPKPKDFVSHVN